MKNKYGILGGTFDPVHEGHLNLAKYARKALALDKVILIPAYTPPHKRGRKITPAEHRLEMLKVAAKEDDGLIVSDIEIERKGRSFTIDTIRTLKKEYPETEFFFIIGADMLPELHLWKEVESFILEGNPVIATRPGYCLDKEKLINLIDESLAKYSDNLMGHIIEVPPIDISSSQIRHALRQYPSEALDNLPIPRDVKQYILDNKLYSD